MEPIGLYLHIPFCLHKCGYCDFNSHPLEGQDLRAYVQALLGELRARSRALPCRPPVASVFFGGGTPTTLPSGDLGELLRACRESFDLLPDCEITCEANPATLAPEYLCELREAGFNRLSLGVQSFDPEELRLLERVHSVEEVLRTVDQARRAGFDNLSLDLMFALPGHTRGNWARQLEQALALAPEHLSCYNLTIEPRTAFFRLHRQGRLRLPDEDRQLALYQDTRRRLEAAGYAQYEISNYARSGYECRHNLLYWMNGDYLGFGAGAVSYRQGVRSQNLKSPEAYCRSVQDGGEARAFAEQLNPRAAMGETLMLGLRLREGVNLKRFEQRFQVSFQGVFGPVLERLLEQNLITLEGGRLALSERGWVLADSVIVEFLE